MSVSLIAAMGQNRVIGTNNRLPWRLPADLQLFKRHTTGHPVLMGRKTFESIGRPLPGRLNIILTTQPDFAAAGCETSRSIEAVLQRYAHEEIFVIGGAEIYTQLLPHADKLYITQIEQKFEGDAYFPEFDLSDWKEIFREEGITDEKNPYSYYFSIYERKAIDE